MFPVCFFTAKYFVCIEKHDEYLSTSVFLNDLLVTIHHRKIRLINENLFIWHWSSIGAMEFDVSSVIYGGGRDYEFHFFGSHSYRR